MLLQNLVTLALIISEIRVFICINRRADEPKNRQADRQTEQIVIWYIDGLITFTRDRCERERI